MINRIKCISKGAMKGMLISIACLGWWGFFYPEFTMVEGTYRVVTEAKNQPKLPEEGYQQLLKAKPEQIRIKSKLLETLLDLTEKQK